MKRISIFLFLCLILAELRAQDPQFSQFFAAPMYHNPAFTGAPQKGRLVSNFRSQYSGIYVTSAFSADTYFKKYNSGLGIIASIDKAGSAGYYRVMSTVNYAYEVQLSSGWVGRGGLALGIINSGLNKSGVILGDQLNLNGNNNEISNSIGQITDQSAFNFDISSGVLVYNKYAWFGLSTMHMNQPRYTLRQNISDKDQKIELDRFGMRTVFTAGFKIPLEKRLYGSDYGNRYIEKTITPTMIYKRQLGAHQLDLGAYVTIKPLVFGLYYRDIPFVNDGEYRDAIIFLLGFKHDYISAGYSYDLIISKLGGSGLNTHELSFSYEFENPKRKRRRAPPIPCPKF